MQRRVKVIKVNILVADYPKSWELQDGSIVTVRPMVMEDRDKLLEFFRRIPEGDLRYLKDDVTDQRVIEQWAQSLDYERVLPLVVVAKDRIVADASLHRRKEGWRRHLGGIRVVVDPIYRHKGLASRLIDELADLAKREGLERLTAEIPADDIPAVDVFEGRGFREMARFARNIIDRDGKYHNLAVYHLNLAAGQ